MRKIWILIFSLLFLTSCSNQTTSNLYRLLIFYGTPEGVNHMWDIEEATKIFTNYDYIIFGEGLEEPTDHHYESTKSIISEIHTIHKQAKIFGYVYLGVTKNNLSFSVLLDKLQKWRNIGVDGIFLDTAGYDYGVSRARLNSSLQAIHNMGMPAFVNAWDPDDVMGNKKNPIYNPDGKATEMDQNDYYLLEDFLLPEDITNPNSTSVFFDDFKAKMDKVIHYRKELGVKMLSISVIDYSKYSNESIEQFFHMNEAAAGVFSLDGYGISPIEYSSSSVDEDIVREFPYMMNYMSYYSTNVNYTTKMNNQDFSRLHFRIHSEPGKHYYTIPH